MSLTQDTIAAIATAPGRGGVAVVRVSGPDAWALARTITGRELADTDAGRFFRADFAGVDDGLMLVFKAPRSYTGEDTIEFQGHGGSVAPRRVLEACLAAGARLARRGEFTLRAFLNGRLDLSAAEAVIDLVDARTDHAADDAFARLNGALKQPFERLYADLLELSSRLEHALDFDEGELPASFAERAANAVAQAQAQIQTLLTTAREGRLLREGALVVLAGAPNAGKSSLLNALLGVKRAIVSAAAGTTRDTIEEALIIDGWALRLTDTAGLRVSSDEIEAEGIERAQALIDRADLVLALDCELPEVASERLLKVHAKCDLAPDGGYGKLAVSALTGAGLDKLKAAIAERLAALSAKAAEAPVADVTTREREHLERAASALAQAQGALDPVIAAGCVRDAASEIGKTIGREYSADLLDALFSRFCVGK